MKKTIYIVLLFVSLTMAAKAQSLADPDKIWISPAAYTMDQEITWYFDMSSANISDDFPLGMWIWGPGAPSWQDQGEPTPLVFEGDKIWSLTMTPTTFFNKTADELFNNGDGNYWFLLRSMDGSSLIGTLSTPKIDHVSSFEKSGKVFDYKPTDFQIGSTLSILFNANAVDGFMPVDHSLHLHSGLNDWTDVQNFDAWDADVRTKTEFRHLGNGIYKMDFVPEDYYGVSSEYDLENIVFLVAKWDGASDWGGSTDTYKITAEEVEVIPRSFSIFPQKISVDDIVVITSDNNDRNQQLSYTITGGSKTITGTLTGDNPIKRQRAFIYLGAEFKGMDISKISIMITDQQNAEIYEGDIPLVKVDNLK